MKLDYVIFYCEASIVCIAILGMMLIHDRFYSSRQEKQICFNRVIVSFVLYFISDAFWASVLGGALPGKRWLIVLLNLTNYVLLSLMAYEWFMFMAASEKMPFRNDRQKRILYLLPMAFSVLFMATAYIVNPLYWISESGEVNGWYAPLQIAAPAFYLLTAFILSVRNARKTESREEKKNYRTIGIFPLGVMAFGMVQVISLDAPTFCFGCTFMLLWFYIQHMQSMISVDELTHLNNRGQIDRYMDQMRFRENVRVSVMMLDIDRFKQINDTYGHAEGDRALTLVSEALRQTCERIKTPIFIGRYGGDEFTLIIQDPGENDEYPEQVARTLRELLAEKQEKNRLPYSLEISIGYEELRDKNDTLRNCLIRADEKLYHEKHAKGAVR